MAGFVNIVGYPSTHKASPWYYFSAVPGVSAAAPRTTQRGRGRETQTSEGNVGVCTKFSSMVHAVLPILFLRETVSINNTVQP